MALIYRDFSENLFQETIELMNLAADIDERIEPHPSYVFFCGSNEDRHTALTTNRLLQVIDVADQLGLISQLMTIEKGLSCEAGFDPYPYRPVGTRTRIISGPMMGTEGVVIERKNEKARMVLEVTTLGQGAVMEIDTDLLEPIH